MAYVYRHIRLDKNEPFYIGIGLNDDIKRAYDKSKRNKIWQNIAAKTEYDVDILIEGLSWEDACKKEVEFIKLYGRKDLGTGTLCNLTIGGDGIVGLIKSESHREKLRQANTGKIVSLETREKLRKANLGKRKEGVKRDISKSGSAEHREKLRKAKLGTRHSVGTKLKMSSSQKGISRNNKSIFYEAGNIVFKNLKEASEYFKIGGTAISKQITGKRKNKFNLIYIK